MISRGRAAETAAQSGSRRSCRFKVSRRPVLSAGIDPSNGGLPGDLMLETREGWRVSDTTRKSVKQRVEGGREILCRVHATGTMIVNQFTVPLTNSVLCSLSSAHPCRSYHPTYHHLFHPGLELRDRSRAGDVLCCWPAAGIWQSSAFEFWKGYPDERNVDATALLCSSLKSGVVDRSSKNVCGSMFWAGERTMEAGAVVETR